MRPLVIDNLACGGGASTCIERALVRPVDVAINHDSEAVAMHLANAQGFPCDYTLDPIGPKGKPLSISSSIRMIGNTVCPDVAEALASANVPLEWFMQVAA